MNIIKHPLLYVGLKGEKILQTLFDKNTNLSCIHPHHISQLGTPIRLGRIRHHLTTSDRHYNDIREAAVLDFYINGILLSDEFLLIPGLSEAVILGDATIRKWRIRLDFEHKAPIVDPSLAKLRI